MMDNEWTKLTLENMPKGFFAGGYEVERDFGSSWRTSESYPTQALDIGTIKRGMYRFRRLQSKQLSPKEKLAAEIECEIRSAPIYSFQQSGIQIESLVGHAIPKMWEYIKLNSADIPPE